MHHDSVGIGGGGGITPNFTHCLHNDLHCSRRCSSFVSTNGRRKSHFCCLKMSPPPPPPPPKSEHLSMPMLRHQLEWCRKLFSMGGGGSNLFKGAQESAPHSQLLGKTISKTANTRNMQQTPSDISCSSHYPQKF